MKTTMKKVLSMALALVLVLGMLPMAAQATHTHHDDNANNTCDEPGCHYDLSTCGANNHAFDTTDCTATKTCTRPDCGHTVPAGTHTTGEWRKDHTGHWKVCSVCNANVEFEPHHGNVGTATCKDKAVCEDCGDPYGELSTTNHAGGTEVRNAVTATCVAGYSGDTYCLGCNTKIATGSATPADPNAQHSWEAATATTPEVCTICRTTRKGALGTSTFNVYVVMGGVTQNGGSFTMTAGSTKTANDILNAFLATSTYSASTISSYYVTANGTQLTGNQTLALAAASTYTLTIVPSNSLNNNQNNNNNNSSSTFTVGFVPNYNTYNYATYVANNIAAGAPVYSFHHNITRTGYTLEGWYYDAATTQRVPNDAVVTGNATFYAKWTQVAPYNVSVVIYTNGNKTTPTVTLDLYEWAQDGVITLADLQQAVVKHGIKANNNAGLSVYGPFTPNQWTSYVSHDYFRNSTERVSVNAGEATVLYAMVHNVKITKGTVDPYGAIADKSNPKTGDMIYAPMMVLGLSASALAVLFYLNKKRAF